MKRTKRLLCILLAFVMLCTCVCTTSVNAEAKTKSKWKVYYCVEGNADKQFYGGRYKVWYNHHIHKIKFTKTRLILWGGMKIKKSGNYVWLPPKKRYFKLSKNLYFRWEYWDGTKMKPVRKKLTKSEGVRYMKNWGWFDVVTKDGKVVAIRKGEGEW